MRELTDERLQDYVDGRLSEAERAEVEVLLRDDPEAVRRVEAWRAIGRTLREDEAELSPGFYARARERFEESRTPRGWRLLSWETAGLAAAAVLAVAIFVPELMRDPTLGPASETVQPQQDESERVRADSPAPALEGERPVDARKRVVADAPDTVGKVAGRGEEKQEVFAEAPAEMDAEPAEAAGEFAPVPPAVEEAEAPVAQSRRESRAQPIPKDDAFADRDQVLAESAPAPRATAEKMKAGLALAKARPTVQPLDSAPAAGISFPGEDRQDGQRRVVVGLTGADCTTLAYRIEDGSYRVTVSTGGDAAGCAFLLPDDGLPVVLEE